LGNGGEGKGYRKEKGMKRKERKGRESRSMHEWEG